MTRSAAGCLITWLLVTIVGAQAAEAAVYDVPPSIPGDNCAVPVDDEITAWLATVPDGNTARFASGGCYGQDGTIEVSGRTNLVIDGQGSEFRALTPGDAGRANWRFTGGANLTVQNMAVRGSNPNGEYVHAVEWQHGYSVEGVQGMTLSNVQARETWGDGVYLYRGAPSPACGDDASSARNIVISGATLERIGRQGVAVVDAEHVTVQDSMIGPVAWWGIDIETDEHCEIARHIDILHNQFGANRYGVIGSVGFGGDPQVGDVTVVDNTQTAATGLPGECWAPVWILSPEAVYRTGYSFRGNRLLARRNAFEFRRVKNIEVSSNTVTLTPTTGCGKRAGVLLVDSHQVDITSNALSGANNVFVADTLSTGITADGNWTAETLISSGPEGSVNSTSASFGFSSTGPATFECKLDGGAFEPCLSPKVYADLSDGPHMFEVRARDSAGNPDPTPASRSWTVDTVAPLVTLDQPATGATIADATPGISGTAGSQPGDSAIVTVKIWLGSGASGSPLQTKTASRDAFSGAYSMSADTLADGTYTARAEQSDAAGNSGQSDSTTFTIDTTAPATAPSEAAFAPLTAVPEPLSDVKPPAVELGGKRAQKAGKTIKVTAKATSENLWATASGKLAIRGSTKTHKLKGVRTRFIARGQTATLKLGLPSNVLSAARRALRSLRDVRAELKLSVRDAAGNVATRKRTIKLER